MKRLLRLSLIAALAAPVSAAGKGPGAMLIADRTLDVVPISSGELLYLNPFIIPGQPRQFHRLTPAAAP